MQKHEPCAFKLLRRQGKEERIRRMAYPSVSAAQMKLTGRNNQLLRNVWDLIRDNVYVCCVPHDKFNFLGLK